jgi:hypothetical protein
MISSIEQTQRSLSALVALLGDPRRFFTHSAGSAIPSHHCEWHCGCAAQNRRGLCFETGWELSFCAYHSE